MRYSLRLLVLALLAGPAFAPAQKKDDILTIARDIEQLDDRVRTMQKTEADNAEALRQLVQQAVTASAQVTQEMSTLQKNLSATLNTSLSDQQRQVSLAVSPLATQMDTLSKSMDALSATVSAMNQRFDSLDKQFKDLSDKVSTINQPLPTPPPPATGGPDTASGVAIPPGITNTGLWEDARRDYERGYYDTAQQEFANFIRYFPKDTYAPSAGYYLGMISLQGKDYDGAADAFQKVIDIYPGDNKAQDALYQKGVALEKGNHKADALETYRSFLKMYPLNDYAPMAKTAIARLTAGNARGGRRGGAK